MPGIARIRIGLAFVVAGVLSAPMSFAGPEHVATIESECQTQLGYSLARCACFRATAETQLTDKGQAFVAAQVTKDMAAVAEVQTTMTGDEAMAAMQFLVNVPQQCP